MICGAFVYNNIKKAKDYEESRGSSSSFALHEKNQETMTSLATPLRLLQLKKNTKIE
jgi:hypothetical protein